MRSIAAAALGFTAVSFLSFFLIGQQHPFGSEAASTSPSGVTGSTAAGAPTKDCAIAHEDKPRATSCAVASQQPPDEVLRASIAAFAATLREGVLQAISSTLTAVADSVASGAFALEAAADPVSPVAPSESVPPATADTPPAGDASAQALAPSFAERTAVPPDPVVAPPVAPPLPSVEVDPTAEGTVDNLRQAVQQQAEAVVAEALARSSQVQNVAPSEQSRPASRQSNNPQTQTTPPTKPSSTGAQSEPNCTVQNEKGDNWSRSAVQCFSQEVKTSGSSTSSVTTATSSVSAASTTSGAGVP